MALGNEAEIFRRHTYAIYTLYSLYMRMFVWYVILLWWWYQHSEIHAVHLPMSCRVAELAQYPRSNAGRYGGKLNPILPTIRRTNITKTQAICICIEMCIFHMQCIGYDVGSWQWWSKHLNKTPFHKHLWALFLNLKVSLPIKCTSFILTGKMILWNAKANLWDSTTTRTLHSMILYNVIILRGLVSSSSCAV